MTETIEKAVTLGIGGLVGTVFGIFVVPLEIPFLCETDRPILIVITALLGMLVSNLVREAKKDKKLRDNNKVRDETVALITHEMKTGLTSTGWAIQLVLQKYASAISDEDKSMLENVVKSIRATVMHSVNLLDVSMLDIGKLSLSLEELPVSKVEEILKETVEKYVYGAKQKGIDLSSNVSLDVEHTIEVDPLRLRIILENLLENAIQYTTDVTNRKQEINVTISTKENYLDIEVSDSGIGIPEEEKPKIFGEFFRASNARKKLVSGSGIGLFMCHEYIKAHKGSVTFESSENKGTTFFVKIPLKTIVNTKEFLEKI